MHASKSKMKSSFKAEMVKQVQHCMPEMHYHDFYEIYIQDQGERDHVVSSNYCRVYPKDVLLLKPNVLHQSISDHPHTRTIVYFTEDLLRKYYTPELCALLLSVFDHGPLLTLTAEHYYKVSGIVRELTRVNPEDPRSHMFTRLADLLLLILENIEQAPKKDQPQRTPSDSGVSPLVSYVHENFLVLDSITEIADTFYITKSHLCRTFKKTTGYTIVQYINNLKVQRACHLLQETSRPITEIALDCGFNSTMYFCRTFKTVLGITPSEYRKI